jgi:hypothetical protein
LYISVNARPDIAACVAILARRVANPMKSDWNASKKVLRYLKGTKEWRLNYGENDGVLVGYCDADWAGDQANDRKSNSGFVFLVNGAAVSWACRKQTCVSISTMEAEYVALTEASQEVVWLRRLMDDLGETQTAPTLIFEDNQSCLKFVEGDKMSNRSKHIDTKYHFVKELNKKEIVLQYCPSEEMVADVLTKPLGEIKLKKFLDMMGLRQ